MRILAKWGWEVETVPELLSLGQSLQAVAGVGGADSTKRCPVNKWTRAKVLRGFLSPAETG